jgi:uncharacterized protein (DUF1697 family)
MARRVAFLRAVNVGGHTIRMADLRVTFEGLGFTAVETFIASGNVLFDAPKHDDDKLESVIERGLEARFGFPIETFVRSAAELAEVAARKPFERADVTADDRKLFVAFLDRRPTAEAVARLLALGTPDDAFAVVGREVYWLRRGGMGTSPFPAGFLEKTLGMPATLRGAPTIQRLLAKGRVTLPTTDQRSAAATPRCSPSHSLPANRRYCSARSRSARRPGGSSTSS